MSWDLRFLEVGATFDYENVRIVMILSQVSYESQKLSAAKISIIKNSIIV